MSTKVVEIGNAIVTAINALDLSGLGLSLTARRAYSVTTPLEDLDEAVADVIAFEQVATRNDRTLLMVIQTYRVFIRKRFTGEELDGENVSMDVLDDWQQVVQMVRDIAWSGQLGTTGAKIESAEITTPADDEALKSQSALSAMVTLTFRYYENQ
jgi:hypothetical protein